MRYNKTRIALIFWTLFIGIGAVAGATGMFVEPSGSALGMQGMLPYFQVLPFADVLFQDYIFSGIALLIVNGLTNLTAAFFLLRKKKIGIILGGIFGLTLMSWIIIQFVIFPMNFMSTIYFIFGIIQAITGYMAYVFYNQETFVFNIADYEVATSSRELVVYFSRLGYTKKVAYGIATERKAEILELKTKERTEGTLGFWWCGRFGMHRWGMELEAIDKNLTRYDKIIICSPIWVFSIAAPVRMFCKQYAGVIKEAEYVFIHYTNTSYKGSAIEMNEMLGLKQMKFRTICSKTGKIKSDKVVNLGK